MKPAFALLIILAAFGLFGTAFFGVYTAPGLETMPTYQSLFGKDGDDEEKAGEEGKPAGIFPINADGKINKRNNYLEKKKKNVAPGS